MFYPLYVNQVQLLKQNHDSKQEDGIDEVIMLLFYLTRLNQLWPDFIRKEIKIKSISVDPYQNKYEDLKA